METIKFVVTKERMESLTLDDAITLEEMQMGEKPSFRALRNLFALFLVDEDGKYLDEAKARRRLGQYGLGDLEEISKAFSNSVREGVLPPANGGN